ncbi:MAG: sugar diacid recognition domain-containing protein [Anaerovoracaceae bacterium]|nr:sugar diacid recognition domain-containing protein [Anaerovoracaceae bacterium]
MKISKSAATDLIREISSVIDYDINIMNENGVILASTDKERVGQFHEGAHLVIKQNLKELPVYYDEEYAGCRQGINLPLFSDDNIIGVVGITGDVSETGRYARLIKKVTEILVKDFDMIQQSNRREHSRTLFINSWINNELESSAQLTEKLTKYNINPNSPITAALVSSSNSKAVHSFIDSIIDKTHILTGYSSNYGILIGNFSSADKFREYLLTCFNSEFPQDNYTVAIGTSFPDSRQAHQSFHQARKVMELLNGQSGIFIYDEMLLDIILSSVDIDHKKRFCGIVFKDCEHREIEDIIDFINIYYISNGSINAIASELFIHKNTVQYKINKIISRTGLDPRIMSNLTSLYLAGLWYRNIYREKN